MPLLSLFAMLIIAGVALYIVNRYVPMASSIKTILNVVVVVVVCIWVLQGVGLLGTVTNFRITR
jgi:predicted membrane protein